MKTRTKLFSTLAASILCLGLFSCTSKGGESLDKDITATCKLTRSFASKTFQDDGIEEAKITGFIDGDTTNVQTLGSKVSYKIRYLSIDTPESTVGYDKWGKAASVFNEEVLSKATSVVIESKSSSPEKDSSGSRYLAYVWYKTEDSDTYRNFNLELVENGYSKNNCDTKDKYYDYFNKAEKKAMKNEAHIWGNSEDIYYSEDVTEVSIKELKANPDSYFNKETKVPVCVAFDAYVVAIDSSSARTITVEQFNEEDGKYYQYDVFVGYDGTGVYKLTSQVGNYLHFVGWPTGDGSIHGCIASPGEKSGLYTYRREIKYYKTLSNAKVTTATLADGVATFTVSANSLTYTLTLKDSTLTESKVNSYAGTYRTIKCFLPGNNMDDEQTVGFVNLLSDIK